MKHDNEIRAAFDAAERIEPAEPGPDDGRGINGPPPEDPEIEIPPEAEAADFPLNDYGNGLRLAHYFGDDMRFVPRLGWYRWEHTRWAADEDELLVRRDAQQVAGRILGEIAHVALEDWEREICDRADASADQLRQLSRTPADDLTPEDARTLADLRGWADDAARIRDAFAKRKTAHRSHAKASGNTSKIDNMLKEARTDCAIGVNDLNDDPLALNCENGTLRFVQENDGLAASFGEEKQVWTVRLDDHRRDDLISKMVPVPYDPKAPRAKWDRFWETIQPDPEIRAFIKRWFGYSCTGLTVEQKLAFFYGGGRNGKSTAVDTIARVLADYGTTVPIETLTGTEQRKGSDATPDLVRLPGARFVRASEPEEGQRLKEALVKALTGGEALMIRRMMQEFVEVTPEFKLTISGNHKPEIRGSDDGIWRRVMLVPFETQIPDHAVDRKLPRDLWEQERAGIFAWLVEGCLDYLREGLNPPASVEAATEEYRFESDPVRLFLLRECTVDGSDHFEKARDVIDAFNAWRVHNEEMQWGRRTVSNALKKRAGSIKGENGLSYAPIKRSDTGYQGLRISQAALDRIAKYGEQLRENEKRKG